MDDILLGYFQFILVVVLVVVGYLTGGHLERQHYRSIIRREKALRRLLVIASRHPPLHGYDQRLVVGSLVMSSDYFKSFAASLRQIFGGRMDCYESLLDRVRLEAILRMKEAAQESGHSVIFNVKLETASISKGQPNSITTVEVLAYGTALRIPQWEVEC